MLVTKCDRRIKKKNWESVENIMGKGENAGYQHFLLYQQSFHEASFPRSLKVRIVWKRKKKKKKNSK